jgi:hypothetical protein
LGGAAQQCEFIHPHAPSLAAVHHVDDPSQAAELQITNSFYLLEWNFVLARTDGAS